MGTKTSKSATENNGRTVDGRFKKGHTNGFRKGVSGNPGGRPLDTITPHLREIVQERYPGRSETTYGRLIAQALVAQALDGEVSAIRECFDRLEGKPRQAIDITEQSSDWRSLTEQHGVNPLDLAKEAQELADEILAAHASGNDPVN